MDDQLLKQLNHWHEVDEFTKIIEAINLIPASELNFELTGQLARAYNNIEEYDKAIETLMTVYAEGQNDALWNFRLGYAYYYKEETEKALTIFEKSVALGEEDAIEYVTWCQEELEEEKRRNSDRR